MHRHAYINGIFIMEYLLLFFKYKTDRFEY